MRDFVLGTRACDPPPGRPYAARRLSCSTPVGISGFRATSSIFSSFAASSERGINAAAGWGELPAVKDQALCILSERSRERAVSYTPADTGRAGLPSCSVSQALFSFLPSLPPFLQKFAFYSKMQEAPESSSSASASSSFSSHPAASIKEEDCSPEKERPPEAEYISSRCVLFTYFQGDISAVVDEHFSRALSQPSSFSLGSAKAARNAGSWRGERSAQRGAVGSAGWWGPIWPVPRPRLGIPSPSSPQHVGGQLRGASCAGSGAAGVLTL